MARHHNTHGAKLGPRLADVVTGAMTDHLRRSGPHRVKLGMELQHQFFNLVGSEIRQTVAPHLVAVADNERTPGWLSDTLRFVAQGKGQWATILGSSAIGSTVGAPLTAIVQPYLTAIEQDAFRGDPTRALPADTAATLAARGFLTTSAASGDIASGGFDEQRARAIMAGTTTRPDLGTVLELINRGVLRDEDAFSALHHLGYDERTQAQLLTMRRALLSPQELADLVTFGVLTVDEARPVAEMSGLSGHDFDMMVLGNGQPPAEGELLEAYRRGIISEERLHRGLVQGPVRIEWFDMLKALRYAPLAPSDAVAGVVQGHIPDSEGKRLAEEAGVNPDNWRLLVENHGRPPGVQELIGLYQRGSISKADVERAIRQSDIKNEWIPAILQFARRLPAEGMVVNAVRHGALPHESAIRHLLELGYDPSVAAWLIDAASKQQTQHERELTKAEVLALHNVGGLSDDDAVKHVVALGYSHGEADQLVSLSTLRKAKAERDAAIRVVQARYIGHHIDENTASGALDHLGLGHVERDHLIHLWGMERSLTVRGLTEAQVGALLKKGHMSLPDALARWQSLGLSAADAQLVALLY